MEIIKVVTGYLDENCYVLKKDKTCLIVDPGDDYPKIKEQVDDCKVLGILITHGHFDHIGALRNFLNRKNVKIFKKSSVEDEKKYQIGDFSFKTIFTPGHSFDSVSFYFEEEKSLFSGDFIFKNSIGRCDLPTGSIDDMKASIEKIKTYPKDTIIYPGHYDITNLNDELINNEYLR